MGKKQTKGKKNGSPWTQPQVGSASKQLISWAPNTGKKCLIISHYPKKRLFFPFNFANMLFCVYVSRDAKCFFFLLIWGVNHNQVSKISIERTLNRFFVGLAMTHANQRLSLSLDDFNLLPSSECVSGSTKVSSPVPFVPCLILHLWTLDS